MQLGVTGEGELILWQAAACRGGFRHCAHQPELMVVAVAFRSGLMALSCTGSATRGHIY